MKPFICLITGPAGVGKSTTAELLCKEFSKTARIDVDYIRHMIRNGKVRPFPYTDEARLQIELAVKNACDLAKNFNDKGFSVVIDDVVVSRKKLQQYIDQTKGYRFFCFFAHVRQRTFTEKRSGTVEGGSNGTAVFATS